MRAVLTAPTTIPETHVICIAVCLALLFVLGFRGNAVLTPPTTMTKSTFVIAVQCLFSAAVEVLLGILRTRRLSS